MASKSFNKQVKKSFNSETKIKRALDQLDTAVQAWYAEHNPQNTSHYASVCICDYPTVSLKEEDIHVVRCTLQTDENGDQYTDVVSSKQRGI